MYRFPLLLAGLLLAAPAATEETTNGSCEQHRSLCVSGCDSEKFLWFFKGEAYDTCVANCEDNFDMCGARETDDDAFEVIRGRSEMADDKRAEPVPEPEAAQEDESTDEPPTGR